MKEDGSRKRDKKLAQSAVARGGALAAGLVEEEEEEEELTQSDFLAVLEVGKVHRCRWSGRRNGL